MPTPACSPILLAAKVAAALPHLLGFTPTESLLAVCEPGAGEGREYTLRFDLPPRGAEPGYAKHAARWIRQRGPATVLLVVVTDSPAEAVCERVVPPLVSLLGRQVEVLDVLTVTSEVVRSWLCTDARCCPPEGVPLAAVRDDPYVQQAAAKRVLSGRIVQPDRAALASSLAGPDAVEAAQARTRCERALRSLDLDEAADAWDSALRSWAERPGILADEQAALLAVSLHSVRLRDELAAGYGRTELSGLLAELCRRTPAPFDASLCALFALVTYCNGGGAVLTLALDRALASDPDHPLALTLQEVLDDQVNPEVVRRLVRQAARESSAARRRGRR